MHGHPLRQTVAALVLGALAVAFPPAPGSAAPLGTRVHLPDPSYYRAPHAPQKEPVTPGIQLIAHPTTGVPAAVVAGARATIWLGEAVATPGRGVTVTLSTRLAGRRFQKKLPLLRIVPGRGQRLSKLICRVPAQLPRAVYDLSVGLPGRPPVTQHRSVRVLHGQGSLRIALLADHQLWDPSVALQSGRMNPNTYPRRGERREHRAMARQSLHELELLAPDLVFHLGDLVFGLDYGKELPDALKLWREGGLAAFMIPGNHDGYARYGVNLKASLPQLATGLVRCRKQFPTQLKDWKKVWTFLVCVYGDLKPVLFSSLLSDGLVSWRKTLGPTYYAFDLGRYRFIALNTYDGTPERRHAFAIWVNVKGLHLGAPMVDNYGGYLSVKQLSWLKGQLRQARAEKRSVVVLGHHDPRGNPSGVPYHANQSFPTDPVGPDHFEAWNFDGAWDSNPRDGRGRETAANHSGHSLMRLLAQYGGTYVSGHVHRDVQRHYAAGQALAPGIVARRPVTFIKVTTASSTPKPGGYWGYRLLTARPDGTLDLTPYATTPKLASVPAGNLWAEPHAAPTGGRIFTVHTGLPRPVTLRLRTVLQVQPRGYHFSTHTRGAQIRLVDVAPLPPRAGKPTEALHTLEVTLPAAGKTVARLPEEIRSSHVYARPVKANRPPDAVALLNGKRLRSGATLRLKRQGRLVLDASQSRDPDGDPLLPPLWLLDDGRGGRQARQTLTFGQDARHTLRLVVRDAHGVPATQTVTILVGSARASSGAGGQGPRPTTGCAGCTSTSGVAGLLSLSLLGLGVLLILLGGRRRRPQRR